MCRTEEAIMKIPRITSGLELVDDSGDEVCVSGIDEESGIVTLDMLDDDDSYTMSLRELRSRLREGAFAVLEPDEDGDTESDNADEEEEVEDTSEEDA